jgi:hypothetical protein
VLDTSPAAAATGDDQAQTAHDEHLAEEEDLQVQEMDCNFSILVRMSLPTSPQESYQPFVFLPVPARRMRLQRRWQQHPHPSTTYRPQSTTHSAPAARLWPRAQHLPAAA